MTVAHNGSTIVSIEGVVLTTIVFAYGLAFLAARLRRRRPDFRLGAPLAVAFGLRLAAIAAVSLSGIGANLRGGDEVGFLNHARQIAGAPFSSGLWLPGSKYYLHEVLFALQIRVADFSEGALRVTQVGVATTGLLLLAAAVYDMVGPRAARLALWLLALEPASIFFSQFLHKEPLMELASGLVVFGGVRFWHRVDTGALLVMTVGSAIAILTRPYAGWFVTSSVVLVALHASIRRARHSLSSSFLFVALLVGIAAAVPVIVQVSSHHNLQQNLQRSQNANTRFAATKTDGFSSGGNANNLALENVDYSTRSSIIANLPVRVRDVLLRPYPWQVSNTSQQLGVVGTVVALAILFLLFKYALRTRRGLIRLTAPIVYPLVFLTVAYALSVGNAGTGFRYRSHLITLALTIVVVLRYQRGPRAAGEDREPGHTALGRRTGGEESWTQPASPVPVA